MKRFTIISLLVLMTAPALACTWSETHNYYLFSVCDRTDIHETFDRISRDNWKAYLGLSGDDEYWFDADEIIKAARQKGDQLMVSYVQNLKDYLECVRLKEREQYEWDYPRLKSGHRAHARCSACAPMPRASSARACAASMPCCSCAASC